MANWESYRISDIVSEIEERRYVLPVIQRRLVWNEEKMELLFDTLLKGDSFGGIMVIKEEKGYHPLFTFRPFTKDGEPIDSGDSGMLVQNQSFVIDGQQRLQSFYIGLAGSINGKVLYFDLFSNYNSSFEFEFAGDYSKLPKESKDDSRTIKAHKWYPVTGLLQKLKLSNSDKTVAKNIVAAEGIIGDDLKDHVLENVGAFYRNVIGNKCLGISEVALDKTADPTANKLRIVELFRRLNDGGTKLSPFDLVASILKGFEWKMEKFLDETLENYTDIGLSQDNLIKLIFLLQDDHKKEMTDITGTDAEFAISNKERITSCLVSLKKFLIAADLHNYYKEGNRSFIPLFFIVYHLFHKKISNKQIEDYFNNWDANNREFSRIKDWIYYSLLNGVFRSKGAGWIPYKTGTRKILTEIKSYRDEDFPTDKLFDVYYEHGVKFVKDFDENTLNSLDSQFLFYLMYDMKQTIRTQDIDHIMPKSILETFKYDWAKINSIMNFQLLDYGTNRGEKNANPFKQWVNTLPNKKHFTDRHLIPHDESKWSEDKFEDFLVERGKLILGKIDFYVVGQIPIPTAN